MLVVLPIWLGITYKFELRPFKSGWCFGLGYFGAGISWVHVSIATFGGVPLIVSVFLMLLLCAYLALFPALFLFLLKRFFALRLWPLAAPFLWMAVEAVRAHFLTGFPWLSIGYSQSNGPLHAFYPIIGEIGLSAVLILLACVLANALFKPSKTALLSLSAVLLVFISSTSLLNLGVFSSDHLQSHLAAKAADRPVSVALVQGNIEQSIKWRPEQDRPTMDKYMALTEPHWDADIILWPEAAIPRIEILAGEFLRELDSFAGEQNSALITGLVDVNPMNGTAYNNLLALGLDTSDANTSPYSYLHPKRFSKHHLLPIGEFVPFESLLRPLAPIFDLPMSSFSRGDFVQNNLNAKGYQLSPAICFEIAFPLQVRANIFEATDLLVTVSNDAWFGDSHGPHQHLEIARVRAMEFGLPLIRATNTGLTAAFDHKGNELGRLPQFEDGVMRVKIANKRLNTPYYALGNSPMIIITLVALICAIWLKRKYY